MRKVIAVLSLTLVLGLINWSIAQKESHLATGKLVFVALAPVDPRSLMQGDYMALRFALSQGIYDASPKVEGGHWRRNVDASDGYVVVSLDEKNITSYVRIHDGEELLKNELLMFYRVRNGTVKFATNSFFFQEGHAKRYESAKYGGFRVNDKSKLLLVSMHGEGLETLGGED